METVPSNEGAVKPPVFHNAEEHYRFVNSLWPTGPLPALTSQEALSATKRLWRVATGKTWKGELRLTSGNRYTWPRGGVFLVNPDRGWHSLVHLISHAARRRIFRHGKPHDGNHARLEGDLIRYVVNHGWLEGALKSKAAPKVKPTAEEIQQSRLIRVQELIKAWE